VREVDYIFEGFMMRIDDKGRTNYLAANSTPGGMPRCYRFTSTPVGEPGADRPSAHKRRLAAGHHRTEARRSTTGQLLHHLLHHNLRISLRICPVEQDVM
jgi:hypothetical protein